MKRFFSIAVAGALAAASAWADDQPSVGKVSVLDGSAWRDPGHEALAVGSDVRLGDTLHVDKGNLKLTLNDESVVCLGAQDAKGQEPGAELKIEEATFKDQVREGFKANLFFGKIWSHVKKMAAGSNAKFEVTTDRAVAGVRGTIFRVDAVKFVHANNIKTTRIRVDEGKVGVDAKAKKVASNMAPAGGARHQVAGPQEISKEEWERRFAELQKGMQIEVPEELTMNQPFRAQPIRASQWNDAFAKFVSDNGK